MAKAKAPKWLQDLCNPDNPRTKEPGCFPVGRSFYTAATNGKALLAVKGRHVANDLEPSMAKTIEGWMKFPLPSVSSKQVDLTELRAWLKQQADAAAKAAQAHEVKETCNTDEDEIYLAVPVVILGEVFDAKLVWKYLADVESPPAETHGMVWEDKLMIDGGDWRAIIMRYNQHPNELPRWGC